MYLPLFIAKRYLFSKKSHNLINVISMVSLTGILVGTLALITVLSVFNGFESVIKSLYRTFNPDLLVQPAEGKTIQLSAVPLEKLNELTGVRTVVKVIEEDALFKYGEKQYIARMKGISENYGSVNRIDSAVVDGSFVLQEGNTDFAVCGAGIAWILGINPRNIKKLLTVYVPRRGHASSFNLSAAFNIKSIHPSGVFAIQQDFDEKYVLVPFRFAKKILNYNDEATALEIYLKNGANTGETERKVKKILGPDYSVKNRFEQNETLFKVMKSEKTAIFIILVFILILASFNMIGSVSILIVEKKRDIAVLKSLGAEKKIIKNIFLLQGVLITFIGSAAGLVLGFIVLLLQQQYGLLKLGGGQGAFIIDAYPVRMQAGDFILVFAVVQLIGLLASYYPFKYLLRNYDKIQFK